MTEDAETTNRQKTDFAQPKTKQLTACVRARSHEVILCINNDSVI